MGKLSEAARRELRDTPPRFTEKQAGATAKFLRIPPRKARLVIDAVRGKYVSDALAILKFVPNFAARAIEDVINSAKANAENGRPTSPDTGKPLPPLIEENLKVVRAFVDEGPRIKRLQPRAQGRAYRILKRMCHISVILEEVAPKPRTIRKPKPARRAAAAPAAKPATVKKAVSAKKVAPVENTAPEETAPAHDITASVEGTASAERITPEVESTDAAQAETRVETTASATVEAQAPDRVEAQTDAAVSESPAPEVSEAETGHTASAESANGAATSQSTKAVGAEEKKPE